MNSNSLLHPPQGDKSTSITAILEAIAHFAVFTPDTRQAAVRLFEREYGLLPGAFWAIASLSLQAHGGVR